LRQTAAITAIADYFSSAFLSASASDAFAEPGFSGFCCDSCGAQPDSQMMEKVARMRPSGSENRSA